MKKAGPVARRMFKDRAGWRAWLARNHDRESAIELVYYKKGAGKKSVTYEEALEEALCFGWIDSIVSKLDAERYKQRYTPRKPKSTWSAANKERVARLARAGRMAKAGLDAVAAAKKNGSWDALNGIDAALPIPPELLAALGRNPRARGNFERVSLSQKRMFARWIASAKRPETRARRIAHAAAMIAVEAKFGIDWRISSPIVPGAPKKSGNR